MQNAGHLISRRNLLTGIVAAPTLAVAAAPTRARAEGIDAAAARVKAALKDVSGTKLVLLGTGSGPVPGLARRMASNLMVHNGAAYVLDCGLGVTDGYARTGGDPSTGIGDQSTSARMDWRMPDVQPMISSGPYSILWSG